MWWLNPISLFRLAKACAIDAGYWVRPYDMLADRRRWRWQPAARCGFCMCTEDCEDA